MKTKKDFLIIPITCIKNRLDPSIDISKIFTHNLITKEHQKLVLKLSISDLNKPYDLYELVSGEPFYFEESIIKIILNPIKNKQFKIISDSYIININPKFVSADVAMKLYDEITSYGEANDYEKSVKEVLLKNKQTLFTRKRVKNS